jgi:hypothetical protein
MWRGQNGAFVYQLGHGPLKAERRVRFPYALPFRFHRKMIGPSKLKNRAIDTAPKRRIRFLDGGKLFDATEISRLGAAFHQPRRLQGSALQQYCLWRKFWQQYVNQRGNESFNARFVSRLQMLEGAPLETMCVCRHFSKHLM